jgi:hypothetical protein
MEETRKPVGNRWVVAIWIIVFLMVTAFGLFVSQKLKFSHAVPTGPLLTAEVPDGGTLEIIGVSVRERVVEINPPKMFSISFLSSKGSSGGTNGGLNYDTEKEGGKVVRTRLTSKTPAAMLIEFRMKDAAGAGMRFPIYLSQRDAVFEDTRLRDSHASVKFFNPESMDLGTLRSAMTKAGMQVLFQHHDPDAGWINLMGPSLFHAPWPDRYITTLPAWRRDRPTLDFRAIRADGEVVEFSLPNPDFRKAPSKTAPPVTLPYVHKATDFNLTAKNVRRLNFPGNLPFAAVDLKLEYTGSPLPGLKDGPIRLNWGAGPAADEWGNIVGFDRQTIRKQSLTGATVPLNSRHLSLGVIVERSENYPHSPYSGCMVLEGKVTDDGLGIVFEPGPDADLLGISTLPMVKISKVSPHDRDDPTSGWTQLEMTIQGKGDQLETVQRRIGDIQSCEFHFFIGDRNESSGYAVGGMYGSSGDGGGSFHFNRDFTRRFPPGDLAPGTRVRVAMDAPIKSETLQLEFELPATVEPE